MGFDKHFGFSADARMHRKKGQAKASPSPFAGVWNRTFPAFPQPGVNRSWAWRLRSWWERSQAPATSLQPRQAALNRGRGYHGLPLRQPLWGKGGSHRPPEGPEAARVSPPSLSTPAAASPFAACGRCPRAPRRYGPGQAAGQSRGAGRVRAAGQARPAAVPPLTPAPRHPWRCPAGRGSPEPPGRHWAPLRAGTDRRCEQRRRRQAAVAARPVRGSPPAPASWAGPGRARRGEARRPPRPRPAPPARSGAAAAAAAAAAPVAGRARCPSQELHVRGRSGGGWQCSSSPTRWAPRRGAGGSGAAGLSSLSFQPARGNATRPGPALCGAAEPPGEARRRTAAWGGGGGDPERRRPRRERRDHRLSPLPRGRRRRRSPCGAGLPAAPRRRRWASLPLPADIVSAGAGGVCGRAAGGAGPGPGGAQLAEGEEPVPAGGEPVAAAGARPSPAAPRRRRPEVCRWNPDSSRRRGGMEGDVGSFGKAFSALLILP